MEQLQERKEGDLTSGQRKNLTILISEIQAAETLDRPPSIKKVNKLAKGLLIGQHLEEPELIELLKFVNPPQRR